MQRQTKFLLNANTLSSEGLPIEAIRNEAVFFSKTSASTSGGYLTQRDNLHYLTRLPDTSGYPSIDIGGYDHSFRFPNSFQKYAFNLEFLPFNFQEIAVGTSNYIFEVRDSNGFFYGLYLSKNISDTTLSIKGSYIEELTIYTFSSNNSYNNPIQCVINFSGTDLADISISYTIQEDSSNPYSGTSVTQVSSNVSNDWVDLLMSRSMSRVKLLGANVGLTFLSLRRAVPTVETAAYTAQNISSATGTFLYKHIYNNLEPEINPNYSPLLNTNVGYVLYNDSSVINIGSDNTFLKIQIPGNSDNANPGSQSLEFYVDLTTPYSATSNTYYNINVNGFFWLLINKYSLANFEVDFWKAEGTGNGLQVFSPQRDNWLRVTVLSDPNVGTTSLYIDGIPMTSFPDTWFFNPDSDSFVLAMRGSGRNCFIDSIRYSDFNVIETSLLGEPERGMPPAFNLIAQQAPRELGVQDLPYLTETLQSSLNNSMPFYLTNYSNGLFNLDMESFLLIKISCSEYLQISFDNSTWQSPILLSIADIAPLINLTERASDGYFIMPIYVRANPQKPEGTYPNSKVTITTPTDFTIKNTHFGTDLESQIEGDFKNAGVNFSVIQDVTPPSVTIGKETTEPHTLGDTISLSSTVQNASGESYQWYLNNNIIENATNTTYTTSTLVNNDSIKLVITVNGFDYISNIITLTINSSQNGGGLAPVTPIDAATGYTDLQTAPATLAGSQEVQLDPYFKDTASWSKVRYIFKHEGSNQMKKVDFTSAEGFVNKPIYFSGRAQKGTWNLIKITIFDNDGGSFDVTENLNYSITVV